MTLDPAVLVPIADNPRGEIDTKSESFLDLVKSISADGVREPGQARPSGPHEYELFSGARRRLACIVAQRQMPVLVYEGLSDAEAFKIVVACNFAREDLTPIQQGRAVEILLQKCRGDMRAVAATMGQSEQWVALRARLGKLSPKWRKQVESGKWPDYGIGHLELIARLPQDAQDVMLKDQYGPYAVDGDWSVKELDGFINERFMRLLAKAPFPLDGEMVIPEVNRKDAKDAENKRIIGLCNDCKFRSSQEGKLFDDADDVAERTKADRCLRAECYEAKIVTWLCEKKREAEANLHTTVEPVFTESGNHSRFAGSAEMKRRFGTEPRHAGWGVKFKAKPGPQSTPVFILDGPDAGTVRYAVEHKEPRRDGAGGAMSGKAYQEGKKAEHGEERTRLAEDFAAAAAAVELFSSLNVSVEDDAVADRCVAYRLAEGGMAVGPAWDWLRARLGMTTETKESWGGTTTNVLRPHEFPGRASPLPAGVTAAEAGQAMAVFLCERDADEPVFKPLIVVVPRGSKAPKGISSLPSNPARRPEVMAAAAGKFVIGGHFLEKHCSANVQVIARELGVKCKSTRSATCEAILAAGLPAGTMTKDLAAAFGVKYEEPKKSEPTAKTPPDARESKKAAKKKSSPRRHEVKKGAKGTAGEDIWAKAMCIRATDPSVRVDGTPIAESQSVLELMDESYSADIVLGKKPIRRPFVYQSDHGDVPMVCMAVGYGGEGQGIADLEAWRLVPRNEWSGPAHDQGHLNPEDGYRGIAVMWGGRQFVLGERQEFVAAKEKKGSTAKKKAKAKPKKETPGICRECGSTDENAGEGGVDWADETKTLCSSCADYAADEHDGSTGAGEEGEE